MEMKRDMVLLPSDSSGFQMNSEGISCKPARKDLCTVCMLLIDRKSFLYVASLLTTMSGTWGWTLPPAEQQLCLAGFAYFSGHALLPTHKIPRCTQQNL